MDRSEKPDCGLPKLKSMPTLQDPIATIIRDSTGSMTSYMLVPGDPVESGFEDYNHTILLYVNLRMRIWRIIHLKNCEKVPNDRARAAMIAIREMRSQEADVYLCVFGGLKKNRYEANSLLLL